MNFEAQNFDWALGELLQIIWCGKRIGIPAHLLEPALFRACMDLISVQPIEARIWALKIINDMEPLRFASERNDELAHNTAEQELADELLDSSWDVR